MNILYSITIITLYTVFMMLHKTEKKQNIITWLAITTILIFCYNILICTILTFIGILCTLLNLSICNTILIATFGAILYKDKKVQKYYIKKGDIIFSISLLVLVVIIAYKHYGIPFNIKYEITDGSSHYYYAEQFYKNSSLLYKGTTDDFYREFESEFRLPGAYINEGILFKVFDGVVSTVTLFVIFDLFILYMSGILFYFLLKKHVENNKKLYVLAITFALIYMLGYPLNSMLYGYVYLSFALSIVVSLILLISNYEKEEIVTQIALPMLALISFGIFFSYAYFIPIIYIAIITNVIVKSIKSKEEIFSERNIINIFGIIIVPLILGITYFVILPIARGAKSEIRTIIVDGVIYKNYITNLLTFITIIATGIILKIKSKKQEKDNFSEILFVLSILFAIILFIGNKFRKVSEYYFFKAYFIIWPLVIYNAFIVIAKILKDKEKLFKIVTYSYLSIYVIAILGSTLILKSNIGINNIYNHNLELIEEDKNIIQSEELKLLKIVQDSIENNDLYILTSQLNGRRKWLYALHQNYNIHSEYSFAHEGTIERWLQYEEEKYYLAYYEDYNKLPNKQELDDNSNKYKIIYKDQYGFILERK